MLKQTKSAFYVAGCLSLALFLQSCQKSGTTPHAQPSPSDSSSTEDVASISAAGIPDETFGPNGKRIIALSSSYQDYLQAIDIQQDGKVVAIGVKTLNNEGTQSHMVLLRYQKNGELDPTFGKGGKVELSHSNTDIGDAIKVLPSGKILVTGRNTATGKYFIGRYNSDGTLDSVYGNSGIAEINGPQDTALGRVHLNLLPDDQGAILCTLSQATGVNVSSLVKLDNRGHIVSSSTGPTDLSPAIGNVADCEFDSYGNMMVAGEMPFNNATFHVHLGQTSGQIFLSRFKPTGKFDPTFGSNMGIVKTKTMDAQLNRTTAIAVQKDNKVIVGGFAIPWPRYVPFLVRYNSDGTLDTDFGDAGKVDMPQENMAIESVAIDGNGKVLAAGRCIINGDWTNGEWMACIKRFNPNGMLDTSFADGGRFALSAQGFPNKDNFSFIKVAADGSIFAAGSAGGDLTTQNTLIMKLK